MCYLNRILLTVILVCNALIAQAAGEDGPSNETNQNRPESMQAHVNDFWQRKAHIETLFAALKRIIEESPQAVSLEAIQQRIQLQIDDAEKLYRKGNHFTGRYLMDITYQEVQDLVIQARNGSTLTHNRGTGDQYEVSSDGLIADENFERLSASIDALLEALVRVSEEKNMQQSTLVVQENVAQIREQASRLKASNDASGAVDSLQKAYTLTRGALSALRDGDTLVMSLNFVNKKEEYEYYFEKTESLKMVLSMLAEFDPDTGKSKQLERLIVSVEPLLAQAMELAASNDHDSAVPIMDKAYTRYQSGLMMALTSR